MLIQKVTYRGWYTAAASFLFLACSSPDDRTDRVAESASPPVTAQPAPPPEVTERGIGALRIGMPLADTGSLLAGLVEREDADSAGCHYVRWRGASPGFRVMIDGGVVARIDVDSTGLATAAGASVGDSEARIDSLYAGRVTVAPHKYTSGRYLTVQPASAADSSYRIVFETDSVGRVLRYRAGSLPAVEYVEGCG